MQILATRCHHSFSPWTPVVKASKHLSINTQKMGQVYLADFLDPQRWEEVSGVRNILKLNSLPSTRVSQRCPQAVSRDTGNLSSFPLYTSFKICSCSGKTPTLWGAAWESSTILALLDWGLLCCRMARTALTQTTRWSVSFLTLPRMGIRLRSQVWNASYLDQSMLDLAFCWRWSCPPPTLALWKLEGQGRLRLGKPQLCQAQLVCEEKEIVKVKQGYGQGL